MKTRITLLLMVWTLGIAVGPAEPPVLHSRIGETMTATNGALTITNIGKKQNRDYRDTATLDQDVFSPKSVSAMMLRVFDALPDLFVTHISMRLMVIPDVTLGKVCMAAS